MSESEQQSIFQLTEKELPAIAEGLKVDEVLVKELFPYFRDFYETVKFQHLAHIIRAMELLVRERDKNPSFRIVWKSMPVSKTADLAVSFKWPDKFGIVIPAELVNNEKDLVNLRVHVAHELGHLFYITFHPENKGKTKLNHDMANVFGVFAMLERNKFYKEKAPNMCHKTWDDVINDFLQLKQQGNT
jgi:hypothetical protein